MKCPWCSREIGFPGVGTATAQCPYCAGKVTYAFRGAKVLLGLVAAVVAIWALIPYLGPIVVPVALAAPFLAGMYLEKWY